MRHHAAAVHAATAPAATVINEFANIIKQPSTACDSSFSRGVTCAAHQSVLLRMGILGACLWSRLTRNWQQPTCMLCSLLCLLMRCCCVVCVLCMCTCLQPAGETKKGSAARSRKPAASSPAAAQQRPREECKMVLCVNTSLGMGKGKIGAGGQGTLTLLA
jgi:hypothetical protein